MILQVTIPGSPTRRYRLRRDRVVIGRRRGCDVALEHPGVPDVLCSVELQPGGLWFAVLPPETPGAAPPRYALSDEAQVEVGPLLLRLEPDPQTRTKPCPNCGVGLSPAAMFCVRCGYDLKARRRVASFTPPPTSLTPPIIGDDFRPPQFDDAPPPADAPRWTEPRWTPLLLALAAAALIAARFVFFPPESPLRYALGALLAVLFEIGALVGVMMLVSHFGSADIGELPRCLLKCAALSLAVVACVGWSPVVYALVGGGPAAGPIALAAVTFFLWLSASAMLPLMLLGVLFEIEFFESLAAIAALWFCTLIVTGAFGIAA